jgi:Arc/MetJ-type ribon-helix-helix transcriptional regulator
MTTRKVKLAISMSPVLLQKVKSAVARGRTKSVSAYIEHAVRTQLAAEADFDLLIAEQLERTGGPASSRERGRARKLLRGAA